jgi:competence protein ComEC
MNEFQKIFLGIFVGALILLGIAIEGKFDFNSNGVALPNASVKDLAVFFLDVGVGHAIYIRTPHEVDILIDGGPNTKVLTELGEVMPFWDKNIEMLILTHPHSDHVAGLVAVLERYDVGKIYYTGVLHTAPDFLAFLKLVKDNSIPMEIISGYGEIELPDGVMFQFIYPEKELVGMKVESLNDTSIVTKLIYGDNTFLFTGDIEAVSEKRILASDVDISADVLKVAHHGSASSSSLEFLSAVSPSIAVIQTGKDNRFGHPHLKIVERLKRIGAEVFRNDEIGRILITSDGRDLRVAK